MSAVEERQPNDVGGYLWLLVLLATMPLLPSGAELVGLPDGPWFGVALTMLVAMALAPGKLRRPSDAPAPGLHWLFVPWGVFITALAAAAVHGVLWENELATRAFVANLRQLPASLAGQMDQVWAPLYSVRSWLMQASGLLAGLAVARLVLRSPKPRRLARQALGALALGGVVVALVGCLQYFSGFGLHPFWVAANPDLTRVQSTLEDPNLLAACMLLFCGVTWFLAMETRGDSRGRQRLWLVALVPLVGALLASVSRVAWIAGFVSLAMVIGTLPADIDRRCWRRARSASRWVLAGGVLLVSILFIGRQVMTTPEARYRPTSPLGALAQTLDPRVAWADVLKNRTELWGAAIALAAERPLTGHGLGRFPRLVGGAWAGSTPENTHNYFLQLAAESGLVGLGAYLFLLLVLARGFRLWLSASTGSLGARTGAAAGVLGFVVTGTVAHPMLTAAGQVFFALTVVLLLIAGAPSTRSPRQRGRASRTLAALTIGVVVAYWVGAGNIEGPVARGDRWRYTAGLYSEERDEVGAAFRWTGPRAILCGVDANEGWASVQVAPGGRPEAAGAVKVSILSPQGLRSRVLMGWHWETIEVPFEPSASESCLTLIATPAFVPGAVPGSSDMRALGVMLRPFDWQPSTETGTEQPLR